MGVIDIGNHLVTGPITGFVIWFHVLSGFANITLQHKEYCVSLLQ